MLTTMILSVNSFDTVGNPVGKYQKALGAIGGTLPCKND